LYTLYLSYNIDIYYSYMSDTDRPTQLQGAGGSQTGK
jgi:hypothetical protein